MNSHNPSIKEGEITKPSKPLEEFSGIYHNDGYGKIKIEYHENKLFADYINQSELHHYDKNEFECYQLYKYYKFNFLEDSTGKITLLQCNYEPKVSPIEFIKNEVQ